MKKDIEKLISAPCVFCGYSGGGYWAAHTHDEHCPFCRVSGKRNRKKALRNAIKDQAIKVRKQAILLDMYRGGGEMEAVGAEVVI